MSPHAAGLLITTSHNRAAPLGSCLRSCPSFVFLIPVILPSSVIWSVETQLVLHVQTALIWITLDRTLLLFFLVCLASLGPFRAEAPPWSRFKNGGCLSVTWSRSHALRNIKQLRSIPAEAHLKIFFYHSSKRAPVAGRASPQRQQERPFGSVSLFQARRSRLLLYLLQKLGEHPNFPGVTQ